MRENHVPRFTWRHYYILFVSIVFLCVVVCVCTYVCVCIKLTLVYNVFTRPVPKYTVRKFGFRITYAIMNGYIFWIVWNNNSIIFRTYTFVSSFGFLHCCAVKLPIVSHRERFKEVLGLFVNYTCSNRQKENFRTLYI